MAVDYSSFEPFTEDSGARPTRPAGAATALVAVRSIRRFGGVPGLYEVRWRDGRRRRRALALIDDWSAADRVVGDAVWRAYPDRGSRPVVVVPESAWR